MFLLHLQLIVSSYDAQISILSVILKCEWGLSVSQEALVTSVSGTMGNLVRRSYVESVLKCDIICCTYTYV